MARSYITRVSHSMRGHLETASSDIWLEKVAKLSTNIRLELPLERLTYFAIIDDWHISPLLGFLLTKLYMDKAPAGAEKFINSDHVLPV